MDVSPAAAPEAKATFTVRFYRPGDRAAVRRICADTGFLGTPIDPLFEDRELFADYLTQFYTDREPESTLVLEKDGEVMGYLMGARGQGGYRLYRIWNNALLFLKGIYRYFARPYNASTRRYVKWLLRRAASESPVTPKGLAHFHINVRPEARGVSHARLLIDRFLAHLVERGEKGVYAQVIAFEERRTVRTFQRYGFQVIDRKEVTKYRHLRDQQVFLFTILKDLTANGRLYGVDLHRPASEADANAVS